MTKRKLLDALNRLPRANLANASLMFRYQGNLIVAVEKIKHSLRITGVSDKRIKEIVEDASKKAVTSFRPFLDWLDVLATEAAKNNAK